MSSAYVSTITQFSEYLVSDETHRTTEGKNAYIIKIRGFLSYTASEGIIAPNIPLSITSSKCSKERPVTNQIAKMF